jgi:methyl-accepting chemotaxis protein
MLNNMKIGSRLFLGFAAVLIMTTSMTFIAIFNMGRIQGNLDNIVKSNVVQAQQSVSKAETVKNSPTDALYAESVAMYQNSRLLMFVLTGVVFALAALIAWYLTRGIVRPLNHAVIIADALAVGNLNKKVEVLSKDEIGQLLSSMQTMVRKQLSDLVFAQYLNFFV